MHITTHPGARARRRRLRLLAGQASALAASVVVLAGCASQPGSVPGTAAAPVQTAPGVAVPDLLGGPGAGPFCAGVARVNEAALSRAGAAASSVQPSGPNQSLDETIRKGREQARQRSGQAAKDWAELASLAPAEIRSDTQQIAEMYRNIAAGALILDETKKYEEPLGRLHQWGEVHCNWPTLSPNRKPG